MTPAELKKNIGAGKVAPVYFFLGREEALRDTSLEAVTVTLLPPHARAFDYDVHTAKAGGSEEILCLAKAIPVVADRRLVVVKGADALSRKDWEVLTHYLMKPLSSTCLIFIMDDPPPGVSPEVPVYFSAEEPSDIKSFLMTEIKTQGKKMSPGAVTLLMDAPWGSLQELKQEVEKLAVYVGDKQTIDEDDVGLLCSAREESGAFALTDSLGDRDGRRALRIVGELLDRGDKEIGILAMLSGHFRRLTITQNVLNRGGGFQEVREALGGKFYPFQKFAGQSRRFTSEELLGLFERFLESDKGFKGGRIPSRIVLESLVLDIVGYPGKIRGVI